VNDRSPSEPGAQNLLPDGQHPLQPGQPHDFPVPAPRDLFNLPNGRRERRIVSSNTIIVLDLTLQPLVR
jgi:hypothetical protein